MTKRLMAFTLALVTLMAMCLTGCGNKDSYADSKPYDYDLSKYITLSEYKGIEMPELESIDITSDDIKKEIDKRLIDTQQTTHVTEGVVENGDNLFIDYVGTVDGVEFEHGSTNGSGTMLEIGSNSYIAGFETGLIGKNIGDTVVLDLQFPNPYPNNMDLSGKDCQFTVTIHYKEVVVTPEYNLEWVEFHSDCKSLNEYEETVYDDLYAAALETAEYNRKSALWQNVVDASEVIEYPTAEVEAARAAYADYIQQYIGQYGYDMQSYLTMMGKTQEEYDADLLDYAQSVVKNEMVLYSIARAENIEATQEEIDQAIEDILDEQGCTREEFAAQYGAEIEDAVSIKDLTTSILLNKIMDFLIENSVQ